MIVNHRLRRHLSYATIAALAMLLVACAGDGIYPNTTFEPKTDLGRAIDFLWNRMLFLGTIVFILTEAALLFVVWKYRYRGQQEMPRQIHGNTSLEILWTLIPAVVLVFIAVPTVRTIFETQAPAPRDALHVEVIGHQWWWEFRIPEYEVRTANELYLPIGRTINFELKTRDVLHSFWIPQLGAKRDLISNKVNYVWLTTDSVPGGVWNGFCTEYCGASHANMHFRIITVTPQQFESWVAGQRAPAAFAGGAATPAGQPPGAVQPQVVAPTAEGAVRTGEEPAAPGRMQAGPQQRVQELDTMPMAPDRAPLAPQPGMPAGEPILAAGFVWPRDQIPRYAIPNRPMPNVPFDDNLVGDAARGEQAFMPCIGCHTIRGNPIAVGTIGPDLTHFGSRFTLAAGMYPNDSRHLARWIKNAPRLKPGSLMPAFGRGEYDARTGMTVAVGGLDDQQIADIVAYLQSLR
jgi:cytochrome c oxidase subunit II